jgi:hypothetical protein
MYTWYLIFAEVVNASVAAVHERVRVLNEMSAKFSCPLAPGLGAVVSQIKVVSVVAILLAKSVALKFTW